MHSCTMYSKTPICRAPGPLIYRASIISPKSMLYDYINAICTPIYCALDLLGLIPFPHEARYIWVLQ